MTFGLEIEAAKEIILEMFTFVFAKNGYLTLEEDFHTFFQCPTLPQLPHFALRAGQVVFKAM